jgi:hypothetical protein
VPFAFVPRRQRVEALIILVYPVFHILFVSRYTVRFTRTLLPAIPPLLVLVALGAFGAWILTTRLIGDRPLLRAAAAAGLAVAVVLTAWAPLQLTITKGRNLHVDSRQEAREWIDENVEDDARIVLEAYTPWVDPARFDVHPVSFALRSEEPSDPSMQYLVLTRVGSGRFLRAPDAYPAENQRYEAWLQDWCEVATFGGLEPVTVYSRAC